MRRFIRTFTVGRHTQFTVLQDGEADPPYFAVVKWTADNLKPRVVGLYNYMAGSTNAKHSASVEAIEHARDLWLDKQPDKLAYERLKASESGRIDTDTVFGLTGVLTIVVGSFGIACGAGLIGVALVLFGALLVLRAVTA